MDMSWVATRSPCLGESSCTSDSSLLSNPPPPSTAWASRFSGRSIETVQSVGSSSVRRHACQRLHRALQVAQVVVPIDRGGGRQVGLPECLRRRTEVRIRRSPWRKCVGHRACSARSSSPRRRAPPRRHAGTTCPAHEGIASVSPSTDQRSGSTTHGLTATRSVRGVRRRRTRPTSRPRTRLRHVCQPLLAREATSRPRLLEGRSNDGSLL